MDDYDGLSEQVHVIAEEAGECATALRKEGPERLAYECWDVIQAAEGALRRLENNGVDIEAQRAAVEKHCRERGYYDMRPPIDADCAACISVGADFSPTCNGKPCPHWDVHHV
jgi:NTP pyrophosphatase (non-canonical NTP hydrolase)